MSYYIIKLRGGTDNAVVVNCVDHEDLIMNFPPFNYSYLCEVNSFSATPRPIEFDRENAIRYRDMINSGESRMTVQFIEYTEHIG
jgi:hypothetical protein